MSRPITMSARTLDQAQRSSAAMQRDFAFYMPAVIPRRHPSVLRMRDALILSLLAVLVAVRWFVRTEPVADRIVQVEQRANSGL